MLIFKGSGGQFIFKGSSNKISFGNPNNAMTITAPVFWLATSTYSNPYWYTHATISNPRNVPVIITYNSGMGLANVAISVPAFGQTSVITQSINIGPIDPRPGPITFTAYSYNPEGTSLTTTIQVTIT